jgi:hypothetical protein
MFLQPYNYKVLDNSVIINNELERCVSAGDLVWNTLYMRGQLFWLEALFTMLLNMRVVAGALLLVKVANTGNLGSIFSAWIST